MAALTRQSAALALTVSGELFLVLGFVGHANSAGFSVLTCKVGQALGLVLLAFTPKSHKSYPLFRIG